MKTSCVPGLSSPHHNVCQGDLVHREPAMGFVQLVDLLRIDYGKHTVHSRPGLQLASQEGH